VQERVKSNYLKEDQSHYIGYEILDITGEFILKKLGGLPEEDKHCAFLSADALQEALTDYMIKPKSKKTERQF